MSGYLHREREGHLQPLSTGSTGSELETEAGTNEEILSRSIIHNVNTHLELGREKIDENLIISLSSDRTQKMEDIFT